MLLLSPIISIVSIENSQEHVILDQRAGTRTACSGDSMIENFPCEILATFHEVPCLGTLLHEHFTQASLKARPCNFSQNMEIAAAAEYERILRTIIKDVVRIGKIPLHIHFFPPISFERNLSGL